MTDPDFIKFLATLGVGGVLAGVIFLVYRKDIRQYTDLWKAQSEILIDLVKSNIEANESLKAAVEALHRRLDERTGPRL